jgi:hypothetical protein
VYKKGKNLEEFFFVTLPHTFFHFLFCFLIFSALPLTTHHLNDINFTILGFLKGKPQLVACMNHFHENFVMSMIAFQPSSRVVFMIQQTAVWSTTKY